MGKMLFIYSDTSETISFSPAIQILSSVLKMESVEVDLIHLHHTQGVPFDDEVVLNKVITYFPDVIGFSAVTYQYEYCNYLVGRLKEKGIKCLVILGGIHAIISPTDLVTSNFDAFCIGEGEIPLANLFRKIAKGKDVSHTPGFWFKINNKIIKNPPEKYIMDLNSLPFRDYDIIDTHKLLKLRNKWLSISFSRGCVYTCSFCINRKLSNAYKNTCSTGSYFRRNSIERIIEELVNLIKEYGEDIRVINFDDDLLMLDSEWIMKFTEAYKQNIYDTYKIGFAINGRADLVSEAIIEKLSESGCNLIRVGFETGDQNLRNGILNKNVTDGDFYKSFDLFKKYKLYSLAFSMIGVLGETEMTINRSIEMLGDLTPDLIRLTVFKPYIGTPIYDYCQKNNLLISEFEGIDDENNYLVLNKDISSQKIRQYQMLFPWFINVKLSIKYADLYADMISYFTTNYKFDSKVDVDNVRLAVLKKDKELSDRLYAVGVSHYSYYNQNQMYFSYNNFS